jgi:hypothetical protein
MQAPYRDGNRSGSGLTAAARSTIEAFKISCLLLRDLSGQLSLPEYVTRNGPTTWSDFVAIDQGRDLTNALDKAQVGRACQLSDGAEIPIDGFQATRLIRYDERFRSWGAAHWSAP